jgi:Protein of unknown function (DUF3999)
MRALLVAATAAFALAAAATAGLHTTTFRYERVLAPASASSIRFEPDGPMYAHSRIGFADLRILDAQETQVPWRIFPARSGTAPQAVRVLNAGRQKGAAVALLDLGPLRRVHDRVELDVPDVGFVGRVQVSGSESRRTFTRLATSVIYDVRNAAVPARSTTVVFPPSDFRYLFLRATGISRIDGATVAAAPKPAQRIERPGTLRRVSANPTRFVLDLGYRNIPVDELFVVAATPRYDRDATVAGSNDGRNWVDLARTRVFKLSGSVSSPIDLRARHRYLRVTIFNGDDEPLRGLRLRAFAESRALLVEGGHRGPLRVLYGDPQASPPSYDFARLPLADLGLARARPGRLGPEAANPTFELRPDTRSFVAKHPAVITAALVLAAAVVAVGGFLALRQRA